MLQFLYCEQKTSRAVLLMFCLFMQAEKGQETELNKPEFLKVALRKTSQVA